ncbi:MAG: hypothetical protein ACLQBJ_01735 [Bryobacteraceae bacterium]
MLVLLLFATAFAAARAAVSEISYITESVDEGAGFGIMGERLEPEV